MREIEVDTWILQHNIEEMETALQNVRKELQAMINGIHEMDGMWQGSAQTACKEAVKKSYEEVQELCDHVENLIECMGRAKKEYELCGNKIDSIIAAIRI